jgi:hypothetical protein
MILNSGSLRVYAAVFGTVSCGSGATHIKPYLQEYTPLLIGWYYASLRRDGMFNAKHTVLLSISRGQKVALYAGV